MKNLKQCKGFSLIELAVVFLITGFFLSLAIQYYALYYIKEQHRMTNDNLDLTQLALQEFYGLNGRYPCPSDPTLDSDDANYGVEQCRPTITGDCLADVPENLKCTTIGSRDSDGVNGADTVLIGGLPFTTLAAGIRDTPFYTNAAVDAMNMRFTYAVSELMADPLKNIVDSASPYHGSLDVQDENGLSVVDPVKSAHFVLFSHGDNKKGAYTKEGILNQPCSVNALGEPEEFEPGPPDIGMTAPEKENCDMNDAYFTKGLRSLVDGPNYNDDILVFEATGLRQHWVRSLASSDPQIYNTNIGNVGVGIEPESKLHVAGDIRVEANIGAVKFCDPLSDSSGEDSKCLESSKIAGIGMTCPEGQVAHGISLGELVCIPFALDTPSPFECPSGYYLVGFSNKATATDGNGDGFPDHVRCCDLIGNCHTP